MSAMTMSAPDVRTTSYGSPQVIVTVLNEDGRGYLLSWVKSAFDTGMPECMAFQYANGMVTSWLDEAVSYEPTPEEAMADCIRQLGLLVLVRQEKGGEMTDKTDCPSWAEDVPAPVDRDGNVVPLTTRRLYDEAGRKFEVSEIALVNFMIGEGQTWRVKRPNGLAMMLDRCHLERPDSWERLMEDLDRAAGTFGSNTCACSYLTGDANTECSECKRYEKVRGCTQIMLADVARRIGALRKENGNGD